MLQEKIDKISKYFKSLEINNGILILKVQFPSKWGVFPSDDEKIKVAKSEETPNEWFYYGDYGVISFDEIVDFVQNTINVNLSAEEKLKLLNEKFDELKTIFANESLDNLKNLKFVFGKRKKIKKEDAENKTQSSDNEKDELL